MGKSITRILFAMLATLVAIFALRFPSLAVEAAGAAAANSGNKSAEVSGAGDGISAGLTAEKETSASVAQNERGSRAEKLSVAAVGKEAGASAQISSVTAVADGVRISWSKTAGAAKVAVFRRENDSWQRIASTDQSSFVDKDVSFGSEYRYTVRALNSSGGFVQDSFDKAGSSIVYCAVPVLSLESEVKGVRLRWKAVPGAAGYRVFYRTGSGDWSFMQDTTSVSLLDASVKSGGSYAYTVRCVAADGVQYTSYYDKDGKSIRYFSAPSSLAAKNTVKGVRISWKKVSGADKYGVFYKNSKGKWTRLGTTAGSSIVDEDVRSGKTYTYTVRCMDRSNQYISAFDEKGVKSTFIAAPVVTLSNLADSIEIKWEAVPGAAKYRVFRLDGNSWKRMTDTDKTSCIEKNAVSSRRYSYTVRCISADAGEYTSDFNEGKSITFYTAPKITELSNEPDGVRVAWEAVDGAAKYRVFSYNGKSWQKLADTKKTFYVDKTAESGTVCTYTVRCVDSAGKTYLSDFREGSAQKFIAAPDFTLTRNKKSITVSWNAVGGAQLYRVFYRDNNSWKKLADTKDTSYEYTKVTSGGVYSFTVRCLSPDGKNKISDFHELKPIKFVSMPRVSELENTASGTAISWKEVKGASKYCVFCKTDGQWERIGVTSALTFTHKKLQSGTSYTYTVRCISSNEKEFESVFDEKGKSIVYIAAPQNIKAGNDETGVKIKWTPSAGAEKYRVFRHTKQGWTRLIDVTDPYVVDKTVKSGNTYRYTVRCITADGKSYTSGFNAKGASRRYIAAPKLNDPDFTKDGVVISWTPSAGAEKYRVFYYDNKCWTKLAETTSSKVIDRTVTSGKDYLYTVRCITSDGKKYTSSFVSKGVKVHYIAAPKLQSTKVTSKGLTFSWTKPKGAKYFRLYKKTGGSWVKLTDTTSTSYFDAGAKLGNTYAYTVRVTDETGKQFYSGFDSSGFIITVVTDKTGNFYYYDQTKYDYPYGDDTIAYSGCGPTCFAMIASTIKHKSITPIDAVEWCGNDYYLPNVGTYWSYFDAAADYFNLTAPKEYESDEFKSVINALKKGKYVISSQGPGRFTRGGHFIVLAGITTTGRIIVYDPNGGNNFIGATFTSAQITEAGTHYWVFTP